MELANNKYLKTHSKKVRVVKISELMTMFKEILKASRNNQASIFAFTFKLKKISEIKT